MEHYKLIAFAHIGRSLIVGASMGSTTMGRAVCRVGHRVLCIQDLMVFNSSILYIYLNVMTNFGY